MSSPQEVRLEPTVPGLQGAFCYGIHLLSTEDARVGGALSFLHNIVFFRLLSEGAKEIGSSVRDVVRVLSHVRSRAVDPVALEILLDAFVEAAKPEGA